MKRNSFGDVHAVVVAGEHDAKLQRAHVVKPLSPAVRKHHGLNAWWQPSSTARQLGSRP